MSRRSYALFALGLLAVTGGLAAGLALAFGGGGSERDPTPTEYLSRVAAICERYGRKLDRIPPPADVAAYGEVATSVGLALPVLRDQAAAIRSVRPPAGLRARLRRFFALTDRSVAGLEEALAAANERNLGRMAGALVRFAAARNEAKVLAAQIGFRC